MYCSRRGIELPRPTDTCMRCGRCNWEVNNKNQISGSKGKNERYIFISVAAALLLAAMLLLYGNNSEKAAEQGYRQISMDEAISIMGSENNYMILDVRTAEEYAAGHIPEAVNVPNETIGKADIPELPDRDQLILVYCRSGNRSKQASQKLAELGFTNIVEFGGINSWPGEIASN